MFMVAVNQTAPIGIGLFIGCFVGFGLRAREGHTQGLFQGSVWKTAVLVSMSSWFVSALVKMVM